MGISSRLKIINSGKICFVVGIITVMLSLFALLLEFESYSGGEASGIISFLRSNASAFAVVMLQFLLGLFVLLGGVGLKNCKEWGRKFVIGAVGILLCYLVIFSAVWQINVLFREDITFFVIIFSMTGLGVSFLMGFLLWRPLKFFMSKEVSGNCD